MIRGMRPAAIFSIILAIVYILFQSLHPAYYMHLFPDVFAFHDRALFYFENLTLENLGYNEYQPGAIAFFITLSPVFFLGQSIETFKWALFAANIGFILIIAGFFIRMKKTAGVFLLSLLLVFLGPILLFRFDLLVILLTIFSFHLWEKNQKGLSMAVLAFAVITKVYPVIFLPYLLFQSFKSGKKTEILYLFFIFLACFLTYLLFYTFFFQIDLTGTRVSYNFHSLKSVATESVWASFIYFFHFISGRPLPGMESAYGINAIARSEVFPSIQFYNYFWILPVGVLYLTYFFRKKHWEELDYRFLSLLLLIFLIFSKVLSNQYLAWFLFMLPLIDIKILLRKSWITNIFLVCLTMILHTYIYPLNYSAWLAVLNTGQMELFLFWVMLISNFILPVLAIRMIIDLFKHDK